MSQPSTVMFNNESRYPEGSGVVIRSLRRKTCTAPGVYRSCAHPAYNYTVPATAKRDGGLLYARSTDGCARNRCTGYWRRLQRARRRLERVHRRGMLP